jgi:Copine
VNKVLSETDRYVNTFCKKEKFAGTLHFYNFIEKKNLTIKEYEAKGILCRTLLAIDCTRSMLNPSGNMIHRVANQFHLANKSQSEDNVLKSPRNDSSEGSKEMVTIDTSKDISMIENSKETVPTEPIKDSDPVAEVCKEVTTPDISLQEVKGQAAQNPKANLPVITELENVIKPLEDLTEVLLKYESQKRCAVYGYGSRIGGCQFPIFALNQSERHPTVSSKEEAKECLLKLADKLVPEEPSRLSPIIQKAIVMCKHQDKFKTKKMYTLVVILTDGDISDTQDTVDSIVEASNLPISIIFVGHKGSSYETLEYLTTGQEKNDPKKQASKIATEPQKNEPKKNLSRLTDSRGKMGVRKITTLVNYATLKDSLTDLEEVMLKAIPLQMMQHYNINKEIQERRNLLTTSMSEEKLGSEASGRSSPSLNSPKSKKQDNLGGDVQSVESATKSES